MISIHAPRAGSGRSQRLRIRRRGNDFNPRPPCGGRRDWTWTALYEKKYFNPRPPCGGRPNAWDTKSCTSANFNPRPPCGGRREAPAIEASKTYISIHAPRAGGDPCRPWASTPLWYFNPRSPCGERRVQRNNGAAYPLYFNPRSPCGERQLWMML